MKKRNISSLTLNKRKVSQLQVDKGGYAAPSAQCTMSTCSCVTCRPGYCPTNPTITIPPTQLCTMDCSIRDCGILTVSEIP